MTSPERHVARTACVLLCLLAATASAADPEPIRAGMRLRDALRSLESQGLRIFYSTSVVRSRMRVAADPVASELDAVLAEILAGAGLGLAAGPNETWLVVDTRAEAAPATAARAVAAAPEPPPQPRLEEVIVAASRYELVRDISTSRTTLEQGDLGRVPSFGDDTIRLTARLPGAATNGVSARSNIRGGEIGEMLVRFDGLRLYDPYHLKDFQSIFSTLDPRVVSSMDVYTGGFPATYGNRMSGVVDVESMSPPQDRYHEVGVSFFNSSLLSSGRFAESKGEWVASARRSNLDMLYNALSKLPDRPRYRDAFGKISYEFDSTLRVSGHFLLASDDISLSDDEDREETARADHEDVYYWLRFDHQPTDALAGVTLLSRSRLESMRDGTSSKSGVSDGRVSLDERSFSITSLQTDWSRMLSETMLLQFGGTIDHVSGRYAYADEVEFDLLFDIDGAPTEPYRERDLTVAPSGHQYGAYSNLRWRPSARVTADFGLRWDVYEYGNLDADTLSPRLGLRYALTERTELRLSLGRYAQAQYINELQVSDGEVDYAQPQRSDHLVVGLSHELADDVVLRIEAYEKRMNDLRPRYENLLNSLILLPELKPDRIRIAPQSARARGFEVLIERRADDGAIWWASYSHARVEDVIDGADVRRSWDQTHALSAGMNLTPGRWEVGLALIYRSGWPISRITLDDSGELPIATVVGRNVDRVDFYRSFDVRALRTYELESSALTLSLELINVFDRSNPCCIEYEIGDEDETGELVLETLDYLPRIPSVGVTWKF